jgi:hypothetical protein
MSAPGGSGSGINSVIEAERRARELGGQEFPDAADEHAELMTRRATLVLGAIGVIGGTWWVAGLGAAAIVSAALALGVLVTWRIAARRGRREPGDASGHGSIGQ